MGWTSLPTGPIGEEARARPRKPALGKPVGRYRIESIDLRKGIGNWRVDRSQQFRPWQERLPVRLRSIIGDLSNSAQLLVRLDLQKLH
jgi:hypothetical protein